MCEAGFWIFNRVFSVAAELLYATCLALFFRPSQTGQGLGKAIAVLSKYLLLSLFCTWSTAPQGTLSLLLAVLFIAVSGALGLERARAFLLAFLYWKVRTSSTALRKSR